MTGIPCPRCKSASSRTVDSRKKGEVIRRRRECHHCGALFSTEEKVIASIAKERG